MKHKIKPSWKCPECGKVGQHKFDYVLHGADLVTLVDNDIDLNTIKMEVTVFCKFCRRSIGSSGLFDVYIAYRED